MCYVKIDRNVTEWEWYTNRNTFCLFMHLLIRANWKPGKFEGIEIERGSFVSSVRRLCSELDMTEREVRTALRHLESTGEVVRESYRRFTLFTVCNYEKYQGNLQQEGESEKGQTKVKQTTNKGQTNDKQKTECEQPESLDFSALPETHEEEGSKKGQTEVTKETDKDADFQTQRSTIEEVKNKKDKKIKKESSYGDKKKFFENRELNEAFLSYIGMRKDIRAPVKSDRQFTLLLNSLHRLADRADGTMDEERAINIIDQATVHCWKNFYELKDGFGRKGAYEQNGTDRGRTGEGAGGDAPELTDLLLEHIGEGDALDGNAFLGFRHAEVSDVRGDGVDRQDRRLRADGCEAVPVQGTEPDAAQAEFCEFTTGVPRRDDG
jgi:hypothetical protein